MIPLFKVFMSAEATDAAMKVLSSGYIGQGLVVEQFEKTLKDYFHNNLVVTVNSATSGEHLALRLLSKPTNEHLTEYGSMFSYWPGLHKRDTVLSSPLTCFASNAPAIYDGYKIKWVDINPKTLNMDLDDLARKISPETKVIMLPLWGGMPVNMYRLREIQENAYRMYGFRPAIIIDAAHAMDSKYDGKQVCSFGHITSYSFQAIKHVTSVDGGMLVLPHQQLYERAKLLKWYGIRRDEVRTDFRAESDIEEVGTKVHMNDVNAAIGMANFAHVKEITEAHRQNAEFYNEELRKLDGITLLSPEPLSDSSYWIYTILVDQRDNFMRKMKESGIMVSRVHERNDKHTVAREFQTQLPDLEDVVNRMLCIPVHHGVSPEDRDYIVKTITSGW